MSLHPSRGDPREAYRRVLVGAVLGGVFAGWALAARAAEPSGDSMPGKPFLVTQIPVSAEPEWADAEGMLRADFGDRARIVLVVPGQRPRVLTTAFHSACDPALSFDAERFLFAGKRSADDDWNIYEMTVEGTEVRQITRDLGDCRRPAYQSTLFTLDSPEPWHQLTFVRSEPGAINEYGDAPATSLYSCKLDGSEVRRLTFNLSSDTDPWMVWDGRILFASWQRARLNHGDRGRVGLFGLNLDGTDFALFADDGGEGRRIKHMPCTTSGGLVVFVEADEVPWDGAGSLSSVSLRRPLLSYRQLTQPEEGLFHSPSPLGDGGILVSWRTANGGDAHGVYRFDLSTGTRQAVFNDSRFHDIQATALLPRDEPDGRSSVVLEEQPHAHLYGLDISIHSLPERNWLTREMTRRLRLVEGIPPQAGDAPPPGAPRLAQRRILGEATVEADGSFHVKIPANLPLELQLLDDEGMALRSCGWFWARNLENRGCIGCHEDGELTPTNIYVDALGRSAEALMAPPAERPTVDFRRDVLPIVEGKCVACHDEEGVPPRLDGGASGSGVHAAYTNLLARDEGGGLAAYRYVHPGQARTSPLVWHILGRNTARPWDGAAADRDVVPIPEQDGPALTEAEVRAFIEWIDLGAMWEATAPGR